MEISKKIERDFLKQSQDLCKSLLENFGKKLPRCFLVSFLQFTFIESWTFEFIKKKLSFYKNIYNFDGN